MGRFKGLMAAAAGVVAGLIVVVLMHPEIDLLTLKAKIEDAAAGRSDVAKAKAMFPKLQAAATNACRCARKPGADSDRCWANYRALSRRLRPETMASACMPISTTIDCFGDGPDGVCVLISHNDVLCTDEEAELVAGAWEKALDRAGSDAAYKAADTMTEAIIRGDAVSGPKSSSC